MHQAKYKVLKFTTLAIAIATTGGCVTAKVNPNDTAAAAAPAPEKEMAEPMATTKSDGSYTVVSGDSLWGISEKGGIYGNPYKWPLIGMANKSQITDFDLIYAGQEFTIPRSSSQGEIDGAINHAKTRGAWAVGPVEASDTAFRGG